MALQSHLQRYPSLELYCFVLFYCLTVTQPQSHTASGALGQCRPALKPLALHIHATVANTLIPSALSPPAHHMYLHRCLHALYVLLGLPYRSAVP